MKLGGFHGEYLGVDLVHFLVDLVFESAVFDEKSQDRHEVAYYNQIDEGRGGEVANLLRQAAQKHRDQNTNKNNES